MRIPEADVWESASEEQMSRDVSKAQVLAFDHNRAGEAVSLNRGRCGCAPKGAAELQFEGVKSKGFPPKHRAPNNC